MDKIIEDKEYLTLGKYKLDVSNVPIGRKKIVRDIWNNTIAEYRQEIADKDDISEIESKYNQIIDDIYDIYGLYLIRQPFIVLNRRYPFLKALWQYVKRYLLSVKYINRCNEKDYEAFTEWVHLQITGTKKKEMEIQKSILTIQNKMVEVSEKMNISLERLTELSLTLLDSMVGDTSMLAPSQKTS